MLLVPPADDCSCYDRDDERDVDGGRHRAHHAGSDVERQRGKRAGYENRSCAVSWVNGKEQRGAEDDHGQELTVPDQR